MHKSSPHSRRHFLRLAGTSALAGGGAAVTASRLARGDQQQQTVSANNRFPALTESERLKRLAPVKGKVRMVLDTDAYNEVDDQFAIAYSLLSPERLDVEAIYAAPFLNRRSTGPGDGMEKSYHEILRVLDRMGGAAGENFDRNFVFRGSQTFLSSNRTPVESPAARDLVERAMSSPDPLYVVAIGAPTNVASAILLNPSIIERIVVVWLGGELHHRPSARHFNIGQDVPASQIIFDCGVPFVHITCRNVAEMLRTTIPEMERWMKGRSRIGDYLLDIFADYGKKHQHHAWSKEIWDISTLAWLINASWVKTEIVASPILTDKLTYQHDASRHSMRMATYVKRDSIFRDLFQKLASSP